jgi:catechol 2,3-dioxygenase-like lactoylglutathione lyase family enzyme
MATVETQAAVSPNVTFLGFIHEGVPCSRQNLDACIKFYLDVLGLRKLPRPKALDDMGVPGAWLADENNTVQFHLIAKDDEYRPGPDARMTPAGRHTAWMVKNLDVFRARLRELGVPFNEVGNLIGGAQLFIKDPEGHTWEFQEPPKSPRP